MAANSAPSFTLGDGRLVTDFNGHIDTASSIAIQGDGKILVAGTSDGDFAVVRYNADGTLDTTFDGDGKVTTDFGQNDTGAAIALQSNGKILVAGTSFNGSNNDFAVVRYNADGSLDTTFDADGKLTTAVGSADDAAASIVLQADGKIVVAGTSFNATTRNDFAVVRYDSNGSLDTSFDGDGKTTVSIGRRDMFGNFGSDDIAASAVLRSDGRILVGGASHNADSDYNFSLAQFNTNGSLDPSFNAAATPGTAQTDLGVNDFGRSLALQPDDKIIFGGYSFSAFVVVRYNADGTQDSTFGSGGTARTRFDSADNFTQSVAVQPDGKIVTAGTADWQSNTTARRADFAVTRYNADGTPDPVLDADGKLFTDFGGADTGSALALQADGKIVVAGTRADRGRSDFALARYNPDGSLDTSLFHMNTLDGTASFTAGGPPVVLDADVVVFDTELAAQGNYAGSSLRLARHGGNAGQDSFSATGGVGALSEGGSLTLGGLSVGSVVTNSGGALLLTFNSNATQPRINEVLESIAYSNSSARPTSPVQIDWTFSDGNDGSQGTGGPRSITGSSFVTIAGGTPPSASAHSASLDMNGDGLADVLWRNVDGRVDTWQMNGPQISTAGHFPAIPSDWTIVDAHADFNRDGRDDIVWRNLDGRMDVWQMDGTQIGASASFARPADWLVLDAHGDYNGDGKTDILWRNRATGQVEFWQMNGLQVAATGSVSVPTDWTVVDTHADFNGDGKSDLLWRNLDSGQVDVWLMNGVSIGQGATVLTVPLDWTIVDAHGDYDGDGKSDILWRNSVDGRVDLWLMNGAGIATGAHLPTVPLDWVIADGHGDYNGDGKSDILWRNDAGARVDVWQMNGAQIAASSSFGNVPGVWTVMDGHSDYGGDGQSDVLWRSMADGQVAMWTMNGTQRAAVDVVLTVPADWAMQDTAELGARIFGNAGNNSLFGTVNRDTFESGAGSDTVTGGGGADRILFSATPNGANVVTITDFHSGSDELRLGELLFPSLPAGPVAASSFVAEPGAAAHDGNDFILYDTATGRLSYDADGSGAAAAALIAILTGHPMLAATDIQVGLI
jgi:uncharacterized delta-60 repeat protein